MTIKADTPILTASGWMLANTIRPGDIVFGQDGAPKTVTSVQAFDKGPTYEVLLDDGLTICGGINMRLITEKMNTRELLYKGFNARLNIMSLQEIMDNGLRVLKNKWYHMYSVPTTKPIQLPETDLPVPPFIAGVWFGKSKFSKQLFVPQEKINDITKRFRQHGYVIKRGRRSHERVYLTVRPSIEVSFLTKYSEKQTNIPLEYLSGSVDQRLEFLRGLIYQRPKSFNVKTGRYQYFSWDFGFLKRVQGLVESLGIRTTMTKVLTGVPYRMYFRTDLPIGTKTDTAHGLVRHKRRFIKQITEIEPAERVYIETDGPFLAGEGFLAVC